MVFVTSQSALAPSKLVSKIIMTHFVKYGDRKREETPEKAVQRNTETINKNKGIPFKHLAFFLLSTF